MVGVNNAFVLMGTRPRKYVFKTDISSVYQMFWVTYDILMICPDAELDFDSQGKTTIMSITNSNLSYSQIQSILYENIIEYEKVS